MGLRLMELADGFSCWVTGELEAAFIYAEIFEDGTYDLPALPRAPFVVDVGANIGLYCLWMKRRHPDARILAFEPAPGNAEALHRNLRLHGAADGVTVRQCGLGAAQMEGAKLTYYPGMSGNSTLHPEEKVLHRRLMEERLGVAEAAELFAAEEIPVRIERLSSVLREARPQGAIDLLKVDVEGAEAEVLAGIDAADWPRIGALQLEVADVDGRLAEVERLLRGHGYTVGSSPVPRIWEELKFWYVTAARSE
ncbi:FkbM family methyltransferase [Streptomyces sp. NPDC001381]|uniref:FkbM family methyltransferase n=1 Tax=Streptomyces sp. NPDC001381 TaxID=3364567 RepID=UPI00367FCC9D